MTKKTIQQTVTDGWVNVITGLGLAGRDKKLSATLEYTPLSQTDAENLFAASDIAEKIVKYPVQEAFKAGVVFTQKELDEELQGLIETYLKRFDFMAKFKEACEYARQYGSGALFFGVSGDANTTMPLDLTKSIAAITYIQPLHRHELEAGPIQTDITLPGYGMPMNYKLKGTTTVIDRSRLVIIDGAKLTGQLLKNNQYFGDSVLGKIQDKIRNYDTAYDAVATLIQDYSQGIFKMKGLTQLIAAGKDKLVADRLALVDLKRSLVRSIVIDADGEEFTRDAVSLAGVPEILNKMAERLTCAAEMPHTILLGEGASGTLSGAGESEERAWKDYVAGLQEDRYYPALMDSMKIMLSAKDSPTSGTIPEGFDVEFPSLYELDDVEAADVRYKNAQADALYISNQVLDPDEVAMSRFGSGKYSNDIRLNMDMRGTAVPNENASGDPEDGDNDAQKPEGATGNTTTPVATTTDEIKSDVINYEGGEWVLKSHTGKVLGKFKSKKEAEKREKQVKMFKKMSNDSIGLEYSPYFQLPETAKECALEVLKWKQENPDTITGMTTKVEKRARAMSEKFFVDQSEVEEIAAFKKNLVNYLPGQEKPWEDPTTVAVMSFGGVKTIEWAFGLIGE